MTQIDARSKSIRELMSGVKYSIDYYQREYKWKSKQVLELLEDLENKFNGEYESGHEREQVSNYKSYFLGSIVISQNNNGENFIIDGQQRLTSLTLLFIYIHNQPDISQEQRNDITNCVYSTKFGKKSFNLNVKERAECLDELFKGNHFETSNGSESVKTIIERYQDIVDNFPESLKNSVLPYFTDWLLEKVLMVQITAFSDDDAYTIFETMNDRGLSLNQSEMLKGYLLSNILNDDEKEAANQIWRKRVLDLIEIGKEEEIDFIKSWLRANYADSIRERKKGALNKDFDKIGTEFHKWVRENKSKLYLERSADFYNLISKDYIKFSDHYLTIRRASKTFDPELESIYYNAHNNFTLQYPVLLAPLTQQDNMDTVLKKLKITSRFLDIMIARRFANFRILSYSGLVYTMFNLIKDIRNKDLEQLAVLLTDRLNNMDETFEGIKNLYLHQQNRRHIHYLLARMTYFVEKESGVPGDFIKYVSKDIKKPYEIEHLWADKYERHTDEYDSAQEFSQSRNYFGALILLPRGFNQSLNSDEYKEKVKHYIKDNLIAKSLNSNCYDKNPSFRQFIAETSLPFKPYNDFKKADLEERQELYKLICEKTWDPKQLMEILA